MATYEFESLADIAKFFEGKVTDAMNAGIRTKLVGKKALCDREAATWGAAAKILRDSVIKVVGCTVSTDGFDARSNRRSLQTSILCASWLHRCNQDSTYAYGLVVA